jgi:hypothetical protein
MTVTPAAATLPSRIIFSAVATKSRSTLPSRMTGAYRPWSAADRLRTASGKRA